MRIIAGSIDLSKIDESRIIYGKNGAKYYNVTVVVNDEKDQYGNDCAFQQGQTKEEREAKERKVYIGNGKTIYNNEVQSQKETPSNNQNDNSDLPF